MQWDRVWQILRRVLWALGGVAFAAAGAGLLVAGLTLVYTFGPAGSVTSESARVTGEGRALVSDGLAVAGGSPLQEQIGRLTLTVRSESGQPVFVGLAPEEAVFSYLDGVAYDVVSNVTSSSATVRPVPGTAPAPPPEQQTFWVRKGAGTEATIDWPSDSAAKGYRLVVMNADGSPGVSAGIRLGFVSETLPRLALAASVIGAVLLLPALWMLYRALRRSAGRETGGGVQAAMPPPQPAGLVSAEPLPPPVQSTSQ